MGYSPWGCKESDTTEQLTLLDPYSQIIFSIRFLHMIYEYLNHSFIA